MEDHVYDLLLRKYVIGQVFCFNAQDVSGFLANSNLQEFSLLRDDVGVVADLVKDCLVDVAIFPQ